MRCLVTGAAGHLGSHLTRHLLDCGEEVAVLTRPESDLWRLEGVLDQLRVIEVNLRNIAATSEEIREQAPDTVFHCGWSGVSRETRNRPAQLTDNITWGVELFQIVRSAGCRCWVGVGSQAEYGRQSQRLREDLIPHPDTAYGLAKLCLGQVLQTLCELANIRYVWLRLLAVYGPNDNSEHLIPSVIDQLLAGSRPLLTRGEQNWDYLYVQDAAEAIRLVSRMPAAQGVYNLASGEPHSIREIVLKLRDIIDPALPLGFGEIACGSEAPSDLQADITRLREATGWVPRVDLETGLRRTVDWHRSVAAQHESC